MDPAADIVHNLHSQLVRENTGGTKVEQRLLLSHQRLIRIRKCPGVPMGLYSIRSTTNRIPIETKQWCSPFQRAHDQREAVPLAILISRVTTLAAAGSLVAAAAALAVAGTGPVRAW